MKVSSSTNDFRKRIFKIYGEISMKEIWETTIEDVIEAMKRAKANGKRKANHLKMKCEKL